jgi:predicted MFS family arabinose efflux permease
VPSPLQSTALRRIVAAYTVNRLGTWFGFIALAVAVFDHTHSALAVAGLLVSSQVLPAFVVPALVARVEASSRRGELSGLYLFEAVVTAMLLLLLLWHFLLPAVLLLVALDGTAALAASALLRAAAARTAREWAQVHYTEAHATDDLPAHTYAGRASLDAATAQSGAGPDKPAQSGADARETSEHEAERKANAAINIGFSATFMLGPPLAGVVVAALGGPIALLIDTVSFVLCGAMLLDLRPHVEDAETASVRARVRAAWQHINDVPALRQLLLVEAFALVFFEFSPPIEVAYAKATLHAGDSGYGLLLAAWGLGVVFGSVVFARSSKRSLRFLLSSSTLALGLAYLGWAAAPSLGTACAAGLVGGVGNGVQWAALISAVQRLTPQSLHGRLMGAVESLGAICPAIGFSLAGAIAALSSPRGAFLVAGIGASLSTIAFLRLPLGSEAVSSREEASLEPVAEPQPSMSALSDPPPYETSDLEEVGLPGTQPSSSAPYPP